MMMNKDAIYLLFLLLPLGSCSNEHQAEALQGDPIVLNSSLGGISGEVTRVPIESEHADALPVAFARIGQNVYGTWPSWSSVSKTLYATRGAVVSGDKGAITFNAGSEQYYPLATTNNAVKLIGWYPANSVSSGNVSFPIDGKTDIMWTTSVTGSLNDKFDQAGKVFTFGHQLTRITVKVYAVDELAVGGWGNIWNMQVVNTPGSCSMTLADAPTISWGDATKGITFRNILNDEEILTDVSLSGTTQSSPLTYGYLMVAPASSYELKVSTIGGGTRNLTVNNGSEGFQKGKSYVITLIFKSTAIEPFATIAEWVPGGGNPTGTFPN